MSDKKILVERENAASISISLHPLVIINISDHFTRLKMANGGKEQRVFGGLMGTQEGRTVRIENCFELLPPKVDPNIKQTTLDTSYIVTKVEKLKSVLQYKQQDFLGWYSTGSEITAEDMEIQQALFSVNENPLFIQLDVAGCSNPKARELALTLVESELRVVKETASWVFVPAPYTIETYEAERIAVDHVARVGPSETEGSGILTAHLEGLRGGIQKLVQRNGAIIRYLEASQKGDVPKDLGTLRQIFSLCNQFPASDTTPFKREFINEYNDALLVTYLGSMTKATSQVNDMIDKFSIGHERHARRRFF